MTYKWFLTQWVCDSFTERESQGPWLRLGWSRSKLIKSHPLSSPVFPLGQQLRVAKKERRKQTNRSIIFPHINLGITRHFFFATQKASLLWTSCVKWLLRNDFREASIHLGVLYKESWLNRAGRRFLLPLLVDLGYCTKKYFLLPKLLFCFGQSKVNCKNK